MKAITVQNMPSGTALVWQDVPPIMFGAGEVVIDVYASGVNRADLLQRAGRYPPPEGSSDILGLEVAGTIAELGTKVEGWKIGDRVCALLTGGGYATRVAVPHQLLMPLDKSHSFIQGAGIPEAFLTAYLNLFLEASLERGEKVLIHAGASGVGAAAIQLAKRAGSTVFTTAGSEAKTKFCLGLGADSAINYRQMDFAEEVLKISPDGVDVILDSVGGSYFEKNMRILGKNGRLVNIAVLGGAKAEINLAGILVKRQRIIGSTLRSRPLGEKSLLVSEFVSRFWKDLSAGSVQVPIDSSFPIQDAELAHQRMTQNLNMGKIILTVSESE